MSRRLTRRDFIKSAALQTVWLSTGLSAFRALAKGNHASGPVRRGGIEKRPLGKTGLDVTILGLGCATIGHGGHSIREGARIVEACIDEGINYIDCASTYGDAEQKVGEVIKTRRKEVVLATKTLERNRDDAWKEINRSLERLKTDYVDLLQIHSVNRMEELDRITGKNGSLVAAIRAKEEGLCKHVGITGHTQPAVIEEALRRYPFETVLVPLSSTDKLINDFGEVLFPLARQKGLGIIAMKVLAAGKVTAYVPESLRYAFSLPISTAIVGMESLEELRRNVEVARKFRPMDEAEMNALIDKTKPYATTSVMWWKRT